MSDDFLKTVESQLISAISRMGDAQQSNSSERAANTEIAEANILTYFANQLIDGGFRTYSQYPISQGRNIDLVAFIENENPWLVVEAKNRLHSNSEDVLNDFARLNGISFEDEFNNETVYCCQIVMNRYPKLKDWWMSRGETSLDSVAAIKKNDIEARSQYNEISKHLNKEGSVVGSAEWYPREAKSDWIYEVMYFIGKYQ